MSASEGYGTHPEEIAALLEAVGESMMVLSFREDRSFAALSVERFGAVGSTRLDWSGAVVIERCESFDAAELRRLMASCAGADELAVVFWSNLAVPSVAVEAALVAGHAEAVLECSPECWIYLTDSGVLIEFQDGEGFTAGRVPH
ncbi:MULTISPECIES: hypothetical protein [unclassified Streptomyces]|uniref:Uncharacterized protein n=1 Tax=Streptomyces sp. NBC_00119 TaxID=2975659 RepID=A0AAU1U0J6_9ACTN|nr:MULTISPECIES: hypothetical protein [unclassified Streptomyces]MCX4641428.1 hypothetical protein [Streptomyces sp. NBC_01446]MCX5322151.1 hypothetical protein [Streptomyces sp. NBC_00120]